MFHPPPSIAPARVDRVHARGGRVNAALGALVFAASMHAAGCAGPTARRGDDRPAGVEERAPAEQSQGAEAIEAAAQAPASEASAQASEPRSNGEPAASQGAAPKDSLAIHGSLISRYRFRTSGGARDQDLYETLVLDIGDRREDPFSAHLMGTLFADLDGRRDRDDQYVFPSLADTFNEPTQVLLYEAYVDVAKPPLVSELRVGRQFDYLTPEFAHFDGVRAATAPTGSRRSTLGAYGGVPVRLYDATSASDSIFGLWGETLPWKNGRVRFDWMHVEDDDRFGANSNDLLGLTLWQRLSERARVDARYTRLEEEDRDVRVRGAWDDPDADLRVQASFYQLLETQRNFANEFDPFFSTLQSYFPFAQYRLQASKGLTKRVRVDGGVDLRQVDDSGDEGPFNRDFDREWLSLVLLDSVLEGLTLTLTGDVWNSGSRDIETWGVDATRDDASGLRWSLGSSYSLYRYDYFSNSERDNVRIWYARVRKQLSRAATVEARYDYEVFDDDTFHVLLVGATWRF